MELNIEILNCLNEEEALKYLPTLYSSISDDKSISIGIYDEDKAGTYLEPILSPIAIIPKQLIQTLGINESLNSIPFKIADLSIRSLKQKTKLKAISCLENNYDFNSIEKFSAEMRRFYELHGIFPRILNGKKNHFID